MPVNVAVEVHGLVVPNTSTRQVSTRHNPERYENLWEEILEAVTQDAAETLASTPFTLAVIRDEPPEKVVLGSFEVHLTIHSRKYPIFSKVRRGRFPSARCIVKRVRTLLGVEVRASSPAEPLHLAPADGAPPLHRLHLMATDALTGRVIGILDDLHGSRGGSLTCTDSAGYQLSILASGDETKDAARNRGRFCFVEVEEGSSLVFGVRHSGWDIVWPTGPVYVDANGPAALHLVVMRTERVKVHLRSLSGCPLGAGIRVEIDADRRGLGFRSHGVKAILAPPETTLTSDADGTVSLQEYWGTLVNIRAISNDDWVFAPDQASQRVFIGRPRDADDSGPHEPHTKNDDEDGAREEHVDDDDDDDDEPWVYDSCDEDDSQRQHIVDPDAAPGPQQQHDEEEWTDYKAGKVINLYIDGAQPRQKWISFVSDTVVRAGMCLCKSTQSRGGFIVRVHESSASGVPSVKGWCTCRCTSERDLGLRQTLGYQALARGALVSVDWQGQWTDARLLRRSAKGILHCKLQGFPEEDEAANVAVPVASVRPEDAMLRTDVWRAVGRALLSFSMIGYSCARKQVTRVHVQGLVPHRDLVRGARVARFAGKHVGVLTEFSVQDQWLEFQQGLEQNVPHACTLVVGRSASDEDQWLRPQCAPLQVSTTAFVGGIALQTFGRSRDSRQGDWTCYVAVAQHARVLAAKSMKPPRQASRAPRVVGDFREDAIENFAQQSMLAQAQHVASFTASLQDMVLDDARGSVVAVSESTWKALPERVAFRHDAGDELAKSLLWADLPAPRGVCHALVGSGSAAGRMWSAQVSIQHSQTERTMLEMDCELRVDPADPAAVVVGLPRPTCQSPTALRAREEALLHDAETLAAVRIQSCHRKSVAHRALDKKRHAAMLVQAWFRFRRSMMGRRSAAARIQAFVRGWIARRRCADLEKHVRFKLPPREVLISPVVVAAAPEATLEQETFGESESEEDYMDEDFEDADVAPIGLAEAVDDGDDETIEPAELKKHKKKKKSKKKHKRRAKSRDAGEVPGAQDEDDQIVLDKKTKRKKTKKKSKAPRRPQSAKPARTVASSRTRPQSASALENSDSDLTSLESDEEVAEIAALREELARRRAEKRRKQDDAAMDKKTSGSKSSILTSAPALACSSPT